MVTVDPPSLLLNPEKKHSKTFTVEGVRSSVIKHQLNPAWKDEEVTVSIASIDIARLSECCSLVISVWDEDRVSAHDLIGVFTLPFRDIIKYYKEDFPTDRSEKKGLCFDARLRNNSELTGKLSGRVSLKGDLAALEELFQSHLKSMITLEEAIRNYDATRVGCGCVIN